jgi:hypothetical protein
MFAQVPAARDALDASMASVDIDSYTGREAVLFVELLGEIRRFTDALMIRAARRVHESNAHHGSPDRSAAELCARLGGIEPGDAHRAIATANKLADHPEINNALNAGRLTNRQASVITAAAHLNPRATTELLTAASQGANALKRACSDARLEVESNDDRSTRQRSSRYLHMWTDDDGMVAGRFALPPEAGGPIKAIIDDVAQRRFRLNAANDPIDAVTADALVALIIAATRSAAASPPAQSTTSNRSVDDSDVVDDAARDRASDVAQSLFAVPDQQSTDDSNQSHGDSASASPLADVNVDNFDISKCDVSGVTGTRPTVHIVVDHEVLIRGSALAGERCEIPGVGPVNAMWVRGILGQAFVTAVIKRGIDITTVSHFGRHINAELRTALIVGGHECVVERCQARGYLEIDHQEIDHARHGPTALWNLGLVCPQHHDLKSRGWTLSPPNPATGKRRLQPPLADTG